MSVQVLDFYFPFLVLFYGALITSVLHMPLFLRLVEKKLPEHLRVQIKAHRVLALICLCVGAIWSLQNIWISTS